MCGEGGEGWEWVGGLGGGGGGGRLNGGGGGGGEAQEAFGVLQHIYVRKPSCSSRTIRTTTAQQPKHGQ